MRVNRVSMGEIKVIQGNLLHCKLANSTLSCKFRKKDISVALIQEPYIHKKRLVSWNQAKGMSFTSEKPRTCIYVKKDDNMSATLLPQFTNRDLTTIKLNFKLYGQNKSVIMTSAYLPFEENSPPSQPFQDLIEYCKL